MTWNELAAEYFTKATAAQLNGVLLGCTGFPGFWNICEETPTPEACCRLQLAEIARRSGGDPDYAMYLADEDLSLEMKWLAIRDQLEAV